MVKTTLLLLFTSLLIGTSYAKQPVVGDKKFGFSSQKWHSSNTAEIVTIHAGDIGIGSYHLVQIYVDNAHTNTGSVPAGINIKNCGNASHVAPGSTVICMLSYTNPKIEFTADSSDVGAFGLFQVSDQHI